MGHIHTIESYESIKKIYVFTHTATQINLKALCQVKKPDVRNHMLYNAIYMKCPQKLNL